MTVRPWILTCAGCLLALWSQPVRAADVYDSPEAAKADADFSVQGEYAAPGVGLQVIAHGQGIFTAVKYPGGLPGAGYTGSGKQAIEQEDTAAIKELIAALKVQRIERQSPTIGAKPPEGAVVLFDGSEESVKKHWQPGAKYADGLLQQGCTSVDTFQDCTVHVEFRIPFMPKATGQGRGNSGLYYQGRFETQMLDSFGLEGKDNETGGIYSIKAPDLNMCLPPLVWQTYDGEFTAARYEDGKKVSNARLTVRLNGVLVQSDVELPKTTTAAPIGESPEPGPIYLQDHGNPVRYRNIWVLPRDAQREARRPIVPGFERFHALGSGDPVEGGHLLMGELSCRKCHASDVKDVLGVEPKQAPILTEIGNRVRPEWFSRFLTDPQAAKPGTTMPHVFAGWSEVERGEAVTALAHFLATTGSPGHQNSDRGAAQRGKDLFHQVGCTVCHAPREGEVKVPHATSIPLGKIEKKYTITSLIDFLKNPHRARPSGRMPSMPLNDQQFTEIANYLIGDEVGGQKAGRPKEPNMTFKAYTKVEWQRLGDFSKLTVSKEGESRGLDLGVVGETNNFVVSYEGFLHVERDGGYRFRIGSDDGSAVYVDGKKVADADGIHPHQYGEGRIRLTKGAHPIRFEYFQGGGEWTLDCEIEGPGLSRQNIEPLITKSTDIKPVLEKRNDGFVIDEELANKGRELFKSVGCASCHELKVGDELLAGPMAKPLAELDPTRGCLAANPPVSRESRVPDFAFSPKQREAMTAAIRSPLPEVNPQSLTRQTMTTFNCYACHQREGHGGPETTRNVLFTSTIPEMGDEGRLPPPLDGVGDKLNAGYLNHVLSNGADDRPYMRVAMPRFGNDRLKKLHETFVKQDEKTGAPAVTFDEPDSRIKSTGRHLVGDKGLACVKCHTFGEIKATGIQAIDMRKMSSRLREDWFRRYLFDPQVYRPGTRMPTGFPGGVAVAKDIYGGNPAQQIAAIWTYLKDGDKAGIPDGMLAEAIELKPENGKPVIYRNFIEGLSPRGIGVGYPEHCNLAWDANRMALELVWHGKFIDASKHWVGRGPGYQHPLGDHVTKVEDVSPVAILASGDAPWPSSSARERGYQFQGYRLDQSGRPAFRYQAGDVTVTDFPEPVAGEKEGTFKRTLTLESPKPVDGLYVRVASGDSIEQIDGRYLIDKLWSVQVMGAIIRDSQGRKELLVPVQLQGGRAEVIVELKW